MMQRKKKDPGWIQLNSLLAHFVPFFPEDMSPDNKDRLCVIVDVYREAKEEADRIWTAPHRPKSIYTREDFVVHESIKKEALRIILDSYNRGSARDRATIESKLGEDIKNHTEILMTIENKKAQELRAPEPSNPSQPAS